MSNIGRSSHFRIPCWNGWSVRCTLCWPVFSPISVKKTKKCFKMILGRTLYEIFIFLSKIQVWFSEKIVDFFFWSKNSWKCCGFGLFSCWQLWFYEKNFQKKLSETSWKCWTFRIVCAVVNWFWRFLKLLFIPFKRRLYSFTGMYFIPGTKNLDCT